jgi:hypothetical protein
VAVTAFDLPHFGQFKEPTFIRETRLSKDTVLLAFVNIIFAPHSVLTLPAG